MPEGGESYVCNLSPEVLDQAKRELGEVPSRRQEDIEHIRQWLKKQPHLHARMDDWMILRFLRGCKFSLERTKQKLDMFYTCRTAVPEWYKNRDPQNPKMKELLQSGIFLPLPGYDHKGRKVILLRVARRDTSKFSVDEMFKATHFVSDILWEDDEQASVTGMVMIQDFVGVTASHGLQMTPAVVKKAMTIWQEGYPTRPKGMHYFNTPPAFDTVNNIFKSFMKEKMKKRMHFHGNDLESLQKEFPMDVLPEEYGGTNGTLEELTDWWVKKVDERRGWLLEDEKFVVDETKRPGKPKTPSDLFGLEGSFRKLEVD